MARENKKQSEISRRANLTSAEDELKSGAGARVLPSQYRPNVVSDREKLSGRVRSSRSLTSDKHLKMYDANNSDPSRKKYNTENIPTTRSRLESKTSTEHGMKGAVVPVPAYPGDVPCRPRYLLLLECKADESNAAIYRVKGRSHFELIARWSDNGRGVDRSTQGMMKRVADDFIRVHRVDSRRIWSSIENLRVLRISCEKAMRELASKGGSVKVIVNPLDGMEFHMSVNRKDFEDVKMKPFQRVLVLVEQFLAEANMAKSKINDVVLFGDSAQTSSIQQQFKDFFGSQAAQHLHIGPDQVIARSAAAITTPPVHGRLGAELPVVNAKIGDSGIPSELRRRGDSKEDLKTGKHSTTELKRRGSSKDGVKSGMDSITELKRRPSTNKEYVKNGKDTVTAKIKEADNRSMTKYEKKWDPLRLLKKILPFLPLVKVAVQVAFFIVAFVG